MNAVLAVLALFCVVCHQATGSIDQPDQLNHPSNFCNNRKKCPTYRVVAPHGLYEERRYDPSVWVETERKSTESKLSMFTRLFKYMKGKNADGKKMEMGLPVVGHLTVGRGAGHTESMRFFLGEDTGSFNPPRSTDPDVHIHHDPAMNYYVMGFNSQDWRNIEVWNTQARLLKRNASIGHDEFCAASYGPRGPGQKYNEIWMHTSASHNDHHYHHHEHDSEHDHHHGDHDHAHDSVHGHDHGGDHNHRR